MNIIVLLKRVPDTACAIKIAANGKSADLAGVEFIQNPYDEFAVEAAIQLKEKKGEGKVTVISMGHPDTSKQLRVFLAMGADDAILLKSEMPLGDALSTAKALAEAIKGKPFDLILCGKQATDSDNYQVGVILAKLLNIPSISVVTEFQIDGGNITAKREIEGGREVVQSKLPCLITCQKGLNEPRYPALKGIMAAKKKPLEEKELPAGSSGLETLSLTLPPPKAKGKILGKGVEAIGPLLDALQGEAKVLSL